MCNVTSEELARRKVVVGQEIFEFSILKGFAFPLQLVLLMSIQVAI